MIRIQAYSHVCIWSKIYIFWPLRIFLSLFQTPKIAGYLFLEGLDDQGLAEETGNRRDVRLQRNQFVNAPNLECKLKNLSYPR